MKIVRYVAAMLLAFGLLGVQAQAATVLVDDATYSLPADGPNFLFSGFLAPAGAGDLTFNFESTEDPLGASAEVAITNISFGLFTNLQMSWVSTVNGVLVTTAILHPSSVLATIFAGADINQGLRIFWDDAVAGASFTVGVSVVPIPGAAWLFGTALLGGGIVVGRRRRRRKLEAAVAA